MKSIVLLIMLSSAINARAFTLSKAGFEGGWPGKEVRFYYNPANCPAALTDAINKAFDTWSNIPTSYLKLKMGGSSTATPAQVVAGTAPQTPVIVCDPNFETTASGVQGNFVAGYGFFNYSGKNITYGGMVLNVQSGRAANINTYSATDLAIVVTHEMGHVLGLGHSEFKPALMYYDISAKTDFNLAQDDIDGMSYLYPRNEFEDGLYGCGRIASGVPPANGAAALLGLIFPLAMLGYLRRRATAGYAAA